MASAVINRLNNGDGMVGVHSSKHVSGSRAWDLGVIKPHFFLFCGLMSRWRYDGDAFCFVFCHCCVQFPWRHSMYGRRLVTGVLFATEQAEETGERGPQDGTGRDDNNRETSMEVYYCLMRLVLEAFPGAERRGGQGAVWGFASIWSTRA